MTPDRKQLQRCILSLLASRRAGATICPSEAARAACPEGWRELMPAVREVARQLARAGQLEICQAGEPVDPDSFRGPIRLRLALRATRPAADADGA